MSAIEWPQSSLSIVGEDISIPADIHSLDRLIVRIRFDTGS